MSKKTKKKLTFSELQLAYTTATKKLKTVEAQATELEAEINKLEALMKPLRLRAALNDAEQELDNADTALRTARRTLDAADTDDGLFLACRQKIEKAETALAEAADALTDVAQTVEERST